MKVAGESGFSLCLKRLARMREALFSLALNPGELDTDNPTSAPWLLLGQSKSLPLHRGNSAHSNYCAPALLEEDSNFLKFIQAYAFIAEGI